MGNTQSQINDPPVIKSQPQQPAPNEASELDKEIKKKAMQKLLTKHTKKKPSTQKKESQWKQDVYTIVSYWIRMQLSINDVDDNDNDNHDQFEFIDLSLILTTDIWSVILLFVPTTYNNIFGAGYLKMFGGSGFGSSNLEQIIISEHGVEKIATNRDNIFLINEGNSVECAGSNGCFQLGLNRRDEYIDGFVKNEQIKNCGLISQGFAAQHTFYVSVDNKLYGFGDYEDGQLTQQYKSHLKMKTKGQSSKKVNVIWIQLPVSMTKCIIMDIKCGQYHSIFLTNDGQIYGCGGNEHGQLGLGKKKKSNHIKLIDKGYLMNNKNCKITKIECCSSTTFALDGENDKIIVFGANINGILGCNKSDETQCQNIPIMIPYFIENDIKIMDIKCGYNSICAMDENHNIYTFGYNRYFQCGVNRKYVYKPYKLDSSKFKEEIESIHCGNYHTILLTINNNLVTFGSNRFGQCLLDQHTNIIKSPTFINKKSILPKDFTDIIAVIPGSNFTLLAVE